VRSGHTWVMDRVNLLGFVYMELLIWWFKHVKLSTIIKKKKVELKLLNWVFLHFLCVDGWLKTKKSMAWLFFRVWWFWEELEGILWINLYSCNKCCIFLCVQKYMWKLKCLINGSSWCYKGKIKRELMELFPVGLATWVKKGKAFVNLIC